MYIARKNASTVDERSKGIDSQDPFAVSEIPVAGAIVNPLVAAATSQLADSTVAQLNTNTVGYGAFGGSDLTDHYKFTAKKDTTYSLIVSTDSSNGNIRTEAYADYFDIYFEDATGARVTADFQIKELDLYTKLVEFKVPADGPYYVQVDNAFEQPFEYAIALYDKSLAPKMSVSSKAADAGRFLVTFTSDIDLSTTRPRVDRIEVVGGTLGTLTRGADGKTYTAMFTPTAGSSVEPTVKVLTGAFFSRAGDLNLDGDDANNLVRIKQSTPVDPGTGGGTGSGGGTGGTGGGTPVTDTTAPKVASIAAGDAARGPDTPAKLTFVFSEAVSGFDLGDVQVDGGTLSDLAGSGTTFTATLQLNSPAPADGVVKLQVNKGYKDAAGNMASETFNATVQFDITGSSVTITSSATKIKPNGSAVVTLKFSEPVRELDLEAVQVQNGTASNLRSVGTDGLTFELDVSPSAQAGQGDQVTVTLDVEKVLDRVGNTLQATTPLALALDLSGLRVLAEATVDVNAGEQVYFTLDHSEADALVSVYLAGDGAALELTEAGAADTITQVAFFAQPEVLTGELRATDGTLADDGAVELGAGQSDLSLGLVVVLGTDSVSSGLSGSDSLSVVTDLPSALYGFGGDDTLIESFNTVLLNGGDGIDTYELAPSQGATLIVDTGSPTSTDPLLSLGGLSPAFTGFDLITGFDIAADTFRFAGKGRAEHKTVVGTYDSTFLVFTPDGGGSDLMVFLDGVGGVDDQLDDGELAVVIVGAALAVNTPAIGGGTGE